MNTFRKDTAPMGNKTTPDLTQIRCAYTVKVWGVVAYTVMAAGLLGVGLLIDTVQSLLIAAGVVVVVAWASATVGERFLKRRQRTEPEQQ